MSHREQIKAEVMTQICARLSEVRKAGGDHWKEADALFPHVHSQVLVDACLRVDRDDLEDWWAGVERTIDGEILNRAIGGPEGGGR